MYSLCGALRLWAALRDRQRPELVIVRFFGALLHQAIWEVVNLPLRSPVSWCTHSTHGAVELHLHGGCELVLVYWVRTRVRQNYVYHLDVSGSLCALLQLLDEEDAPARPGRVLGQPECLALFHIWCGNSQCD